MRVVLSFRQQVISVITESDMNKRERISVYSLMKPDFRATFDEAISGLGSKAASIVAELGVMCKSLKEV